MARQNMSLEAMLDEERLEVLALLEGGANRQRAPSAHGARSPSPYTTPRSPLRSMLDVGPPTSPSPSGAARSSSLAGSRSPPPGPVRSMLDVEDVPRRSMLDVESPPPTKTTFSLQNSPENSSARTYAAHTTSHQRSMSDAATKPVEFGPRASQSRLDRVSGYQFGDIITGHQPAMPKRVTQGGKTQGGKTQSGKRNTAGSMADVMRGVDVSNMVLPGPRGRHYSVSSSSARGTDKSKSPHNRPSMRSNSPHVSLNTRTLSPAGKAILDDGREIDVQNAYRRLSDANMARLGGSLSELTFRKRSDIVNAGRLQKDYIGPDGEPLVDDSSDDNDHSSSDEGERGRKAARSLPAGDSSKTPQDRTALSLLGAAEEERLQMANSQQAYQYRSLLDEPKITVTNPSGERIKQSKSGVHPETSFDQPVSGLHTPMDSDEEEDFTDIKRAQKLSFSMTPIISTPDTHRALRIIYRGEFSKIQREADEEHRRLRKYIAATDLSDESAHALEWAIGTVLRDGDTLVAIYCVDEETGIVTGDNVLIPDDPKAMREQAAALNSLASSKTPVSPGLYNHKSSPLSRAGELVHSAPSPAPSNRERTKAEEERERAVDNITERVTKLLRRTTLQVRVIVEVLHCKNPRHMLTEVIDLVNPTLVILGSRGRSALKGVILGSFSNYLVTKSSVPVMVARKRLRKQSKYKRPPVHQVNNLSNPVARSLANAKVD